MPEYSNRKPWMDDDNWECAESLAVLFGGFHHMREIKPFGRGIEVNMYGEMATFDFSRLTDLVIQAHRKLIRFAVMPSGPGMLKISAHKRKHGGGMCERHPDLAHLRETIEDLIEEDEGRAG